MSLRLLPLAAVVSLLLMALTQSSPGAPIPNIMVGLEPQSGGTPLTAITTGPNAEAAINIPPGVYSVFVANGVSLPGAATMTVFEGAQQRTSGIISRAAGRVYAPNTTGPGRMMVNTGQNALIRIRLTTFQPPAAPTCLTLNGGAPRFISAQGSAGGVGNVATNQAMTAARAEWSRLARAFNAPGQPDYSDWATAARTNVANSVQPGIPPTTTVTLTGQPCRRP